MPAPWWHNGGGQRGEHAPNPKQPYVSSEASRPCRRKFTTFFTQSRANSRVRPALVKWPKNKPHRVDLGADGELVRVDVAKKTTVELLFVRLLPVTKVGQQGLRSDGVVGIAYETRHGMRKGINRWAGTRRNRGNRNPRLGHRGKRGMG